jgi:hypothetical protein
VHTFESACGRPLRNGLARRARQRRFGAARGFTAHKGVDIRICVDGGRPILHQPARVGRRSIVAVDVVPQHTQHGHELAAVV